MYIHVHVYTHIQCTCTMQAKMIGSSLVYIHLHYIIVHVLAHTQMMITFLYIMNVKQSKCLQFLSHSYMYMYSSCTSNVHTLCVILHNIHVQCMCTYIIHISFVLVNYNYMYMYSLVRHCDF